MPYIKGMLVSEGKTKKIYAVREHADLVIIESKDDITKNDDPTATKVMANKAKMATTTTVNVFEMLRRSGVPVAYNGCFSTTLFVAKSCRMIPLEVIARRYAVGSYLNRYPNYKNDLGKEPYRFEQPLVEFFVKTTGNSIRSFDGLFLGKVSVEDPLIVNRKEHLWLLAHPKKIADNKGSQLSNVIKQSQILPKEEMVTQIEEITLKAFSLIEKAFERLGLRLVDFKIEFGITTSGQLVIADVIDNDSWRLRTSDWQELSKQLFRDNHDLSEISEKYEIVAKLTEEFNKSI